MKRENWIDAILVFALSLAYLSLLPHCFSVFDEGILAETAERIYLGEVLYRDFFAYWNPGGFWLNAAFFHLAGISVGALRVPLTLLGAVAAVGVWRLARDHSGRLLAVVAGLAVTMVCYPLWWMASSHWYSTYAAIAAAVVLRRCFDERSTDLAPFATGVLSGVTFVMLQPTGGFLCVAIVAVFAWDGFLLGARAATVKRIAVFSLGVLVPMLMMYGYYAVHGALGVMLYDTLLWNLEHYSPALKSPYGDVSILGNRDLPFKVIRWVLMVLPPFIYLLALALTGSRYLRRQAELEDRRLFALTVVGFGLLASNYYFPDLIHLAFGAPPAFAVLAAMLFRCGATDVGRHLARAGAVVFLVFVGMSGTILARNYLAQCPVEISTPRGSIATAPVFVDDFRTLFSFFEGRLSPGERFYVYPYGPGYNFLVGHLSASPYMVVFPQSPTLTTDDELAEVRAAIESQRVRFVVVPFLFRAVFGKGNRAVERYLLEHYRPVSGDSPTLILERKPTPRAGVVPGTARVSVLAETTIGRERSGMLPK